MDYASVALRVNGVWKEDGLNNRRHRAPNSNVDGVKSSFMAAWVFSFYHMPEF
jgi:hypothetical protein